MIRASRRHLLPPIPEKRLSFWWMSALSAIPDGIGWLFHTNLPALIIHGLVALAWIEGRRRTRRLRAIITSRNGESICTFVREFNYRHLDTRIVRATHEELQAWILNRQEPFPIRASDQFEGNLNIDADDLDHIAIEIARRCQRSMENAPANPRYGSVKSVEDLVLFLNHQPALA